MYVILLDLVGMRAEYPSYRNKQRTYGVVCCAVSAVRGVCDSLGNAVASARITLQNFACVYAPSVV